MRIWYVEAFAKRTGEWNSMRWARSSKSFSSSVPAGGQPINDAVRRRANPAVRRERRRTPGSRSPGRRCIRWRVRVPVEFGRER